MTAAKRAACCVFTLYAAQLHNEQQLHFNDLTRGPALMASTKKLSPHKFTRKVDNNNNNNQKKRTKAFNLKLLPL